MDMNKFPLSGIKVVELATAVAAPTAARIMCSFGASVVKIETPPNGDILRPMAAVQMNRLNHEENPIFDIFNSGKQVISLNLKSEKGQEVFHKLLAEADVFVTNVRMRSLENMKLDYTSLKEKYPRLVYAHLSGFGLEGPDVARPGFDLTAFWMRSGAATDMAEAGAYPLMPSFAFGDITSASAFLGGILMGLIGRNTTGKGTMISTSLYGTGMWSSCSYIIESQGKKARNFPNSHYNAWDPFSWLYRCADGEWIAVMEKSYAQDRDTFVRILNMPELAEDPELQTLDAMSKSGRGSEVIKKVESIMATKSSAEWKKIFDENDVANEIARHYKDIASDPQARANGYLDDLTYYGDDVYAMPVPPITFSEYDRHVTKKASPFGGDSNSVLMELGYTTEDIDKMRVNRDVM